MSVLVLVVVVQLVVIEEFERVEVAHTDCSMVVTEADWVVRLGDELVDSVLLVVVANRVSVGVV